MESGTNCFGGIVKYFFLYILIAYIAAPAAVYLLYYIVDSFLLGNETSFNSVFNNTFIDEISLFVGSLLLIILFIKKDYTNLDIKGNLRSTIARNKRIYSWAFILELASILPINILVSSLNLNDYAAEVQSDNALSFIGILSICVITPIAEELVFRGGIEEKLLQWKNNGVMAIILSSLIFAIMHVTPSAIIGVFISALLTGWVYYRTRDVLVCVIMHMTNNIISCIFDLFEDSTIQDIIFQTQFIIIAVFGLAFMVAAIKNIHKITSTK